jgi:thymidine phosphorylase
MLFSLQEMPVTMNLGYQHSVNRKFGITVEVRQCVEFLEWQNARDDFRETTREIYKSELKAHKQTS